MPACFTPSSGSSSAASSASTPSGALLSTSAPSARTTCRRSVRASVENRPFSAAIAICSPRAPRASSARASPVAGGAAGGAAGRWGDGAGRHGVALGADGAEAVDAGAAYALVLVLQPQHQRRDCHGVPAPRQRLQRHLPTHPARASRLSRPARRARGRRAPAVGRGGLRRPRALQTSPCPRAAARPRVPRRAASHRGAGRGSGGEAWARGPA
jgi:hypothetical protein